jgi:hypothetical protein
MRVASVSKQGLLETQRRRTPLRIAEPLRRARDPYPTVTQPSNAKRQVTSSRRRRPRRTHGRHASADLRLGTDRTVLTRVLDRVATRSGIARRLMTVADSSCASFAATCRLPRTRRDRSRPGRSVDRIADDDARSDWQGKYDESLARERRRLDNEAAAGPEGVAVAVRGCLPGWLGVAVVAVVGVVVALRRRWQRRASMPHRPNKT